MSKFSRVQGNEVGVEVKDAASAHPAVAGERKAEITVQDLCAIPPASLTASSGRTLRQEDVTRRRDFSQKWVLSDFVKALAKLPLAFEPAPPGNTATPPSARRVVEVVSGQTLDVFLAERILKPLKMVDTGFHVPADKLNRLAQPAPDVYTGKTPELLDLTQPATFFAGGHGLVSTAGDYLRFAQMLENGGELEGVRILGPNTVQYMSANHVNPNISPGHLPARPGPASTRLRHAADGTVGMARHA